MEAGSTVGVATAGETQARPDGVTEISLEEENDEVFDEKRFRENGEMWTEWTVRKRKWSMVRSMRTGQKRQGKDPAEVTQEVEVEAEEQRRGVVTATRSGRIIKAPTWLMVDGS